MNFVFPPEDKSVYAQFFPNPSQYSLTISESSEIMKLEHCKFASPRKVQRLCQDGHIDCQKITTSRNGQPIIEWLVNEASLRKRIVEVEPKYEDGDAVATPEKFGDASYPDGQEFQTEKLGNDMALLNQDGDASDHSDQENLAEQKGRDVATPVESGDAIFEEPSKAALMIENAKLTAELEGKSTFIEQILNDKSFLREELRDARERGRDVTKIAERMLETLETMAMGGKLNRLPDHNQDRDRDAIGSRQRGDI